MPLEVGLWRVDGNLPIKVTPSGVPLESQLEVMIETDPTILGTALLLVGRQVPTDYGKYIDLLAVDDECALHILELKRDRIPRGGRRTGPGLRLLGADPHDRWATFISGHASPHLPHALTV